MSLAESCITAAVVLTLMTTALPSLNRTRQTYALRSAAHEVAAHMHAARILAVTRNEDCRMAVTSASTYVIECEDSVWSVVERLTMPREVTLAANGRPVFHRRGNVTPTATFTVQNAAGVARVIVNVNGRVRLQ